MNDSNILNDRIIRVADILEQINDLNKMIEVHQDNSEKSMLLQYQSMKEDFVAELNKILHNFQISVQAA